MDPTIFWCTVTAEVFLFLGHWHGRATNAMREWRGMFGCFSAALGGRNTDRYL